MIKIDFSRSYHGFKLHIEGHSNYVSEGEDVVCAAVSSLFYSLCCYLLNFKRESLKVNEIKNGLADIECGVDCEGAMQMACLGFWQISSKYPANVSINISAWNWKMNPSVSPY